MRRVRILRKAAKEAIEAAAWYERQHPGLGLEFDHAVNAAFHLLELVVSEFPKEIIVVAVAHRSRLHGYWRNRLRS